MVIALADELSAGALAVTETGRPSFDECKKLLCTMEDLNKQMRETMQTYVRMVSQADVCWAMAMVRPHYCSVVGSAEISMVHVCESETSISKPIGVFFTTTLHGLVDIKWVSI